MALKSIHHCGNSETTESETGKGGGDGKKEAQSECQIQGVHRFRKSSAFIIRYTFQLSGSLALTLWAARSCRPGTCLPPRHHAPFIFFASAVIPFSFHSTTLFVPLNRFAFHAHCPVNCLLSARKVLQFCFSVKYPPCPFCADSYS